ncbi:hypothetical protein KAR91_85795, partial [Candidatus Pacearchaeota archaeon]|nr:hypothetical protein [Candidatus Pacearchaeota archaeon]
FFDYLEKKTNKKFITEDIATLLLAGIITDTGSFQHANTSPHSMETASKLLDLGARQQEIIKNIYKTKKLSTLKLWGTILSKVQVDPVHRMVWSTISKEDLQDAEATGEETEGIIDDLLTNAPGVEIIFLIKENPAYTSISMRSTTNAADVGKFCAETDGGGHVRAAGFKIGDGRPFDQAVSTAVDLVRKFQAERLNIHPESFAPAEEMSASAKTTAEPEKVEATPQAPESKGDTTYLDFNAPSETSKKETPEQPAKAPAVKAKVDQSPEAEVDEEDRAIEMDSKDLVATNDEPPRPKKRRRRRPRKKPVAAPASAPIANVPKPPTAPKPTAPPQQQAPAPKADNPPAEPSAPPAPPTPTEQQ